MFQNNVNLQIIFITSWINRNYNNNKKHTKIENIAQKK